jgi:hypothetical protein
MAVTAYSGGSWGPIQWEGATPEEANSVGRVVSVVVDWERLIGRQFRERCERFYRQYRGFQEFRHEWVRAGANDRDGLLYDAKKHWGAHLHIPLSFRTIETIVPRAIAHMPKMLYMPRDEQWRKNVETVKLLIDSQQQQINIDLPYQAIMRSGQIYGLGAGKAYWLTEKRSRRRMERQALIPSRFVLGKARLETVFDDPMYEDVDIFDFMWDPYGSHLGPGSGKCEWLVHRQWLSLRAIMERVQAGVWGTASAQKLTPDLVRSLGPPQQHFTEVWQQRMYASGFTGYDFNHRGEHPHELLEFHDGDRVLSVLDRRVLVQDAENASGAFPFQIYRPTPLNKQFVGIGALEPLEHLQRELDTLRSQRRDAATLALAGAYAFDDAAIDEEDLTFGPGAAIRVTNANPKDALFPLPPKEVPGSGYQEENVIRQDIEAVAGMSDALNAQPGGPGSGSATEAQLMQAALGRRIELGSRRFEIEVVRNSAREFLRLDQRMIRSNRNRLMIPGETVSWEQPMDSERWKWFPVGPGELEGEYEIEPEGGSMAARNIPQDRADAQLLMQLAGHNWFINPTKPLLRALELVGIKHPQSWLRDPDPPIPPQALKLLELAGVDPVIISNAVRIGRTVKAPQEGPDAEQVTAMMGAGEAQAPQAPPQMTGAR